MKSQTPTGVKYCQDPIFVEVHVVQNRLLSLIELSNHLGISLSSAARLVRASRITPIRIGRRLLFDGQTVVAELKSNSTK